MFKTDLENATFMFRLDVLDNTDNIGLVTNNVTELSNLVQENVDDIQSVR